MQSRPRVICTPNNALNTPCCARRLEPSRRTREQEQRQQHTSAFFAARERHPRALVDDVVLGGYGVNGATYSMATRWAGALQCSCEEFFRCAPPSSKRRMAACFLSLQRRPVPPRLCSHAMRPENLMAADCNAFLRRMDAGSIHHRIRHGYPHRVQTESTGQASACHGADATTLVGNAMEE